FPDLADCRHQPKDNHHLKLANTREEAMEAYLNKGIKEIIDQYPAVEKILDEYGIGCGPCSVGICQLKDIVDIHNLPADQEKELMQKIAGLIYPGQEVKIPEGKMKPSDAGSHKKFSPPMKRLVDEHVLIKRWIALIPRVVEHLDVESEDGRQLILDGIDLIRSYADRYHHAKEEDILFQYFDNDSNILQVMYEDHTTGRGHVKAMLEALDRKDKQTLARHLLAYQELLTGHIQKEDEILFPWMDRNLSTTQVEELTAKFNQVDQNMGFSPAKYLAFVEKLESQFSLQEVGLG
ncbi:MAG: hemerythrin domain-containing protein, partial [Desulfobacterales bacterium]